MSNIYKELIMTHSKQSVETFSTALTRGWTWLLGLGILFVILGTIGLGMVVGLTLVSVLFLGVILLIAGLSQIIDVFRSKQWKGATWHALIAILYLIAGAAIIYDPFLASTIITALIAWILIVIGTTRLMMAFSLRQSAGWGWLLFAGLTAIILGILILLQWPYSGLWVLGLFIAIELLVNGWTYIFIAIAMRSSVNS
jgi:uncharacterized membrane protein HdeD (DUF308 family)